MVQIRRLLYVVGPENRSRLLWVLFLTIVVAFLDFVSIGGLFPLLTSMFNPVNGQNAAPSLGALRLPSYFPSSPAVLGTFLLVTFIVKAIVSAYSFRTGFRFTYAVQVAIAQRMLEGLFAKDYEYFLSQNSAVLLKNVTAEVQFLAGSVILSAFYVISQSLTIIAMVLLLAVVSPMAAAGSFFVIGALMVGMYLLVSRRLTIWGKERERRLAELNQLAHEALSGVKTVKAMGTESLYLERFARAGYEYARLNTAYQTAGAIPPLLIELILFGGVTAILLVASAYHLSLGHLIPLLGVLGAAAYRLLPAAKNIFGYVVTIRYYATTIDVVEAALKTAEAPEVAHGQSGSTQGAGSDGETVPLLKGSITLDAVQYKYPDAAGAALNGVSLSIAAGSHVALVGSSGSGKTTTIDVVMGLLYPSCGALLVDGVRVSPKNVKSWRSQLGYVSQNIFLSDGSLIENITLGTPDRLVDHAHLQEVLRQAHLEDFVARLPHGVDTPVGEAGVRLSGGERQRVGIARALYRRPRVLILDEATSSLDTVTERAVNIEVLAACVGITVIIVAHRLSTVRNCDRLLLMEEGVVRAIGTYEELLQRSSVFAEMHRQGVA
jgi:ATP-binding cassette, subfamily B, bacterial PglK